MSPYPGEHALGLLFGLIPAILGLAILAYLLWRIIPERVERARVLRERPNPNGFKDDPELQAKIDHLFLMRRELIAHMEQHGHPAKERDAAYRRLGQAIAHTIALAQKSLKGDRHDKRALQDALDAMERLRGRADGAQRLSLEEIDALLDGLPPEPDASIALQP